MHCCSGVLLLVKIGWFVVDDCFVIVWVVLQWCFVECAGGLLCGCGCLGFVVVHWATWCGCGFVTFVCFWVGGCLACVGLLSVCVCDLLIVEWFPVYMQLLQVCGL